MVKSVFTKASFIAFCLIFLPASLNAQENYDDLKMEIQKLNNEMAGIMIAGEQEKMLSFYTEDVISLPSYSPMLRGIEDIKKQIEMEKNSPYKMTDFKLNTVDVFGKDGLYYEIGTYVYAMEMPEMPEPWTDKGKYLTVWERQDDGSLKIKAETWNTDSNPWAEMENEGEMEKPEE